MIPVLLKLSNFTSYGENPPELDFTRFKLAAISGPNGAGKSSLLDGITWCLWGSSRAGDSSDDLVRLGSEKMFVEFSFLLDGSLYTIKRARSKKSGGNTALEIWSGSENNPLTHNLTEGTIKSSQQKIIDLLHLTYDTFINSSFIRQGHADEFTTKGPTERKKILADILGLDHYDKLEEKAKEKIKDAQTKLTLLDYQLLETEAELSQKEEREKKLEDAKVQVLSFEKEIFVLEKELKIFQKEKDIYELNLTQRKKLEENLNLQRQELENIVSQGKMRAERIKMLEESIKSQKNLNEEIEKLKNTQKKLNELQEKLKERLEIEKKLVSLKSNLSLKLREKKILEDEIKEREHKLEDLKKEKARCPTCGQEIDKENKKHVETQIKKELDEFSLQIEKIDTLEDEKEIKKIEINLSSIQIDENQKEILERDLLKLENLKLQKEKLLQDSANLTSEKKVVEEMRILFKSKTEQVKLLEEEFKSLPKLEESQNLLNKLTEKGESLEKLKSQEKEARGLLGQATELISRAKQMEKLLIEQQEKKKNLLSERSIFEQLALAFGKKGIQAIIIENAIPEIEDETNRLLNKLTDGRMKVSLQTQKETKTKVQTSEGKMHATVETLEIIISDEMGERSYELYSGGEAFRVNFALRLAISKLLANRAGARLQFLVIDEGFGTQDAPGRARLIEVIDAIKDDFEKILIITHIEELKEEFPVRVEVSKGATGSTFEIVGV